MNNTDKNILISAIVPIYKGNKYIEEIVHMYERNVQNTKLAESEYVELIFVNDYPEEKLTRCQTLCPRLLIRYMETRKNYGIHGARIRGIHFANGKYIHMLDQDDRIEDNYLASQLLHIDGMPAVVCNGINKSRYTSSSIYNRTDYPIKKCNDLRGIIIAGSPFVSPGQVLIEKNAISDYWRTHRMKKNGYDDLLLWILFLSSGKKFATNEEIIYYHSYNGKNVSANNLGMGLSSLEMVEHLKRAHCLSPYGRSLLRRRMIYKQKKVLMKRPELAELLVLDINILKAVWGY